MPQTSVTVQTSTSTIFVTLVSTLQLTSTISTTTTSTATTVESDTTTSTTVATATANPGYIPCGQTVQGPSDGNSIVVRCNQQSANGASTLSSFTAANFNDCLTQADENPDVTSFDFQLSTSQCTLLRDPNVNFATTPNDDYVSSYFVQ